MLGQQFGNLQEANRIFSVENGLQLIITSNLPLVCRILQSIISSERNYITIKLKLETKINDYNNKLLFQTKLHSVTSKFV